MARILIIAGDGTVSDHLDYAYFRMLEEGFEVVIAAPEKRTLKTAIHMGSAGDHIYTIERQGYPTPAQASFDEIDPSKFDGVLLPGGRAPEYLRTIKRCVEIVRHFVESGKPAAAICHGPLLLLAAGVKGRRLTCTEDTGVDVTLFGNTYVPARGALKKDEPQYVVDGNIVTVFRRPYHGAWVREFLNLLEARGIKRPNKFKLPQSRVLILAGDVTSAGQLSYSLDRMREEHLQVVVAAPEKKRLNTVVDMREEGWDMRERPGPYAYETLGYWISADASFDEIDPASFDGLILPGWRAVEYLRNMKGCRDAVRHFLDSGKPIGSICQGVRFLLAAGVQGRRLTGLDMLESEISAANTYVDAGAQPVIDGNIATVSRRPYYHAWMSSFLTLMAKRDTKQGSQQPARAALG